MLQSVTSSEQHPNKMVLPKVKAESTMLHHQNFGQRLRYTVTQKAFIRQFKRSNLSSNISYKTKYKKYYIQRLPVDSLPVKTSRINKIAMKGLSNLSFEVDVKQ